MSVAQAVADAEAEALRAHEAGECHLSEWSCSHCEARAWARWLRNLVCRRGMSRRCVT